MYRRGRDPTFALAIKPFLDLLSPSARICNSQFAIAPRLHLRFKQALLRLARFVLCVLCVVCVCVLSVLCALSVCCVC